MFLLTALWSPPQDQLSGFLVDQTITPPGREFFYQFEKKWVWPKVSEGLTLEVKEKRARGNATEVVIMVNNEVVGNYMITAREEIIEAYASYAVRQTQIYIQNNQELLKAFELLGNGIY